MYAEYVGLTAEAITLIEERRRSPGESRSEIIIRALAAPTLVQAEAQQRGHRKRMELGQGAYLLVGEKPVLFLTEEAKRTNKPDAIAEIRSENEFYMNGEEIEPSRGSVLQPAMRRIQEARNHRNEKGDIVSLSAWRQWHVERDGKMVSLFELKDPELARRRVRSIFTLDDLDDSTLD